MHEFSVGLGFSRMHVDNIPYFRIAIKETGCLDLTKRLMLFRPHYYISLIHRVYGKQ